MPSYIGKTGACGAMRRCSSGSRPRDAAWMTPATLLLSRVTPAVGRPCAAGDDHHRPLPREVEAVEPVDQPVGQVHAEEEERRDHDPVDRHREVVRRAVQVVAADVGGGQVVVVLEGPLEDALGGAAGVVDHLGDRLLAARERGDLDPLGPQRSASSPRAPSRAASSSSWQLSAPQPVRVGLLHPGQRGDRGAEVRDRRQLPEPARREPEGLDGRGRAVAGVERQVAARRDDQRRAGVAPARPRRSAGRRCSRGEPV